MIKLILFDLDGVLVDACDWHYEALNMSLQKNAGIKISRTDHENKFNGSPTSVKLKILLSEGLVSRDTLESIWEDKQKFTILTIEHNASLDKQKVSMHESLISSGYKIGCVTNSISKTAKLMLEKTGQLKLMGLIISNEDVNRPKPSPECYIKAMKYFEIDPENTLIIEDSEKGYKSAIDSGAYVLRVSNISEVNLSSIMSKISSLQGE